MKQCSRCNEFKELCEFTKEKSRKDGLCYWCKKCVAEHRSKTKKRRNDYNTEYIKNHKEKMDAYFADRYENQKEKILAQASEYKSKHKKEIAIQKLNWRKANPGKYAAYCAKRRAAKLQRTPSYLSREQHKEMAGIYVLAKEIQWLSEKPLEVDHIIPLQGENVSGLHIPLNLQILPEPLNGSKNNKFDQIEHDRINLPLLIKKLSQNL